jgi:DNA-binding GntR family transcriptional regulator
VKTLKALSLREQAGQVIRAGIIAGELEPGEIYSATVLAERLGVSPTPVREAMLDLANVGLVEAVRNRGFRVLLPDEADLDEIGELRLMVEVPGTRLVVERATDEELATLERVVADLQTTAEESDLAGFLLADRQFHLGLMEMTGNRRLVRLVEQLRDQTRLIGLKELAQARRLTDSAREHRELLEALQARDADKVENLMRVHIEHTRGIWAGREESAKVPDR